MGKLRNHITFCAISIQKGVHLCNNNLKEWLIEHNIFRFRHRCVDIVCV